MYIQNTKKNQKITSWLKIISIHYSLLSLSYSNSFSPQSLLNHWLPFPALCFYPSKLTTSSCFSSHVYIFYVDINMEWVLRCLKFSIAYTHVLFHFSKSPNKIIPPFWYQCSLFILSCLSKYSNLRQSMITLPLLIFIFFNKVCNCFISFIC